MKKRFLYGLEHICWVLHLDRMATWLAGEDHTYDVV